jgi:hypothetical protein
MMGPHRERREARKLWCEAKKENKQNIKEGRTHLAYTQQRKERL